MNTIVTAGWAVLAATTYMAPALIAARRRLQNLLAILTVNVFLGWTVIGWAGALRSACCAAAGPPPRRTAPGPHKPM